MSSLSQTPRPRLLRRFLSLLLCLMCLAAVWSPGLTDAPAYADVAAPADQTDATLADGQADTTEFVTTDDPADTHGPDEGDLCFLYTGDGMADPDRREFPVQPAAAPDLPFTITDLVATTDGPDDHVVGYIWNVRNATIDTAAENTTFAFGGYAITRQPYVDVLVKGSNPGEFKIDATMFVIDTQGPIPGRFRVQLTKIGNTKVKVQDENGTEGQNESLGFVRAMADPPIIGIGEETTFTAELLKPDRTHDDASGIWASLTSPVHPYAVETIDGWAHFQHKPDEPNQFRFDEAGIKPVTASAWIGPDGHYTPDAPSLLLVVEVSSLIPRAPLILEGDDLVPAIPPAIEVEEPILTGPNDVPTQVWYVQVPPDDQPIPVQATPYPLVSEEDLPDSWTLRVGEGGVVVPHDGSHPADSRKIVHVDLEVGESVLVVATCGTSEKRIELRGVADDSTEWRPAGEPAIEIVTPGDDAMTGNPAAHYVSINRSVRLEAIASDIDEFRVAGEDDWHPWNDDAMSGVTDEDYHITWEIEGPGTLDGEYGRYSQYIALTAYSTIEGDLHTVTVTARAEDMHARDLATDPSDPNGAADEQAAVDTVIIKVWQVTVRVRQEGEAPSDDNDIQWQDINEIGGSPIYFAPLGLIRPDHPEGNPGYYGGTELVGELPDGPSWGPDLVWYEGVPVGLGLRDMFEWFSEMKGQRYRIEDGQRIDSFVHATQNDPGDPQFPVLDWIDDSPYPNMQDIDPRSENSEEGEYVGRIYMLDSPGWGGPGVSNQGMIEHGLTEYHLDLDFRSYVKWGGVVVSNYAAWEVEFHLEVDDQQTADDSDDEWKMVGSSVPGLAP